MDFHPHMGNISKTVGVIRLSIDSLTEILSHFVSIYIKSCSKLNIFDMISAKIHMHQSWHEIIRLRIPVIVDALHEGTGTVSDTDNGNAYFLITGHDFASSKCSESIMPR